ncbi:hypothetical protein KC217_19990, partial [Mycobacterium tuberculosis]|nr:hypothetical protein [Mycobacterium tuberculosis]
AGVPLNRMALIHAVREVAQHALPKGEFLTPNVLSISPNAITWWCPPAMRRVFFSCKELGKRSAIVPRSPLVVHTSGPRSQSAYHLVGGQAPGGRCGFS